MDRALRAWAIAGAVLLASCSRADVSGVYLAKTDRSASLIQLTQDKAGAVTGRIETIAIGQGGVVDDTSANLDASASREALRFKGDVLTFSRNGAVVEARKASLTDFQKAVAHLKRQAEQERRHEADSRVTAASQAAEPLAFETAPDKAARLVQAITELRDAAAMLNDAVSAAPDFGRQSADNTARLADMARQAQGLSRAARAPLAAAANDIIVRTNQIDVARTRYAVRLDPIVAKAAPLATAVERFCDGPQAGRLKSSCTEANAAATTFESAQVRAAVVFKGYKQTVQSELSRQTELAEKIGG